MMRIWFGAVVAAAMIVWPAILPAQSHYRVAASLPAGDGGWDLASVNPIDRRLYVARTDGVTAIDLATGVATDRIVAGRRVHAALAIPGTHEVLSTNGESNDAVLFDGRTGRVLANIPTGTKPDAAAYDAATRTVWVMNAGSGNITVIDPKAAKALATIPVGGSLELGVSDGHGRMYVNVEDKNQIVVLNTRTRTVVSRFPLEGCDGPTGIAYDPATMEIVSACANGVAIVSLTNGQQLASLPIGKGADGAAFDAQRHVVLIPAGKDGNLTVVRLGPKPAIVGQVATAVSARTIAIDPSTGRAYLPSATLAPPVGNERPKPLPGTFRVVVVAP
jgi:YVTN family beta-propeller protein